MRTSEGMITVEYDKRTWSRGEAWSNLVDQQIPGAPPRESRPTRDYIDLGWRKAHTRDHWCWVHRGY